MYIAGSVYRYVTCQYTFLVAEQPLRNFPVGTISELKVAMQRISYRLLCSEDAKVHVKRILVQRRLVSF